MRLLFPKNCVCCQRVLPFQKRRGGICDACSPKVFFTGNYTCNRCGKPLRVPFESLCKDCKKRSHAFIRGRALFVYSGPMKMAMYRFKYSNCRYMGDYFGKVAVEKYGKWLGEMAPDGIVPVPMYEGKRRLRGYNQAEVFGRALSKEIGVPLYGDFLIRKKNTLPQKGLNHRKRQENLKNAFKIKEIDVKLNCVLIVDDIYTTGTTIDEVTRILLDYGVQRVYFLTICIGSDY